MTYKHIPNCSQNCTSKQANKIMRSIGKGLSSSSLSRLLTSGTRPAKFYSLVKDHKPLGDNEYPLRPNNTASQKVDWFISKILGQLVQFVPSNLKNSSHLICKLH